MSEEKTLTIKSLTDVKLQMISGGYDAVKSLLKGGKEMCTVAIAIAVSFLATKALALGVEIPEDLQAQITTILVAVFSGLGVAGMNWLKNRKNDTVKTPVDNVENLKVGDEVIVDNKTICEVESISETKEIVLKVTEDL